MDVKELRIKRKEVRACLMNVDFSPDEVESSTNGKLTYFTDKGLRKLLLELDSLGVAIVDKDAELPKNRYDGWQDKPNTRWYPFAMADQQAKQDMEDAGYHKTYPLLEGEK